MIDFENVDCFEKMKSMKNNSIDLIMTDHPYGISFKGQTSNTDWNNMTDEEYSNFLFHLFFEFERILKDDGTIWLCCGRTKIPIVFDPFSGSCSSGIACSVCGRNYIGCEIDKDMYDKANNWLNNYDKELVKEYIGSRIRRNEESIFNL